MSDAGYDARQADDEVVDELELIYSPRGAARTFVGRSGVRRLTQPEVRMSLEFLADGRIRKRSWSLALAYVIPEERRASFGADGLALLFDGRRWHVDELHFNDDN